MIRRKRSEEERKNDKRGTKNERDIKFGKHNGIYVRREGPVNELANVKRKREENRKMVEETYKKSNKGEGTPPEAKRMIEETRGDREEKKEEEETLLAILRKIREEMTDMRKEMREEKNKWEERWSMKEKKLEGRMDEMEERLSKMERKKENKEGGGKKKEIELKN